MANITLKVRDRSYELPSYSLTGDILGYLRCGLQYRYTRLGKMPPRSPVQLWFGNFIHGCMDEGFRRYKAAMAKKHSHAVAMEEVDPETIIPFIEERLLNQGVAAWEPWLKLLGYARARTALTELGQHLFPLISQSEVRLTGARSLQTLPPAKIFRRADRYEMAGIIDVVTDVELASHGGNQIVEIARRKLGILPGHFELIIDYKGSRRQPNLATISGQNPTLWDQYAWQVLTYAELRAKQIDSKPVAAGILIYINELLPLESDLVELDREVSGFAPKGAVKLSTDESVDRALIKPWREAARAAAEAAEKEQENLTKAGDPDTDLKASRKLTTQVPWDVRLRRAMRVIPNDAVKRAMSLQAFDGTVYQIECCRGDEFHGNGVLKSWNTNPNDRSTCAACDSRTWCPSFAKYHAGGKTVLPGTPKVKAASQ
jgi:hypothetical protein